MNRYLVEAKYADQAWVAMADKPQDRIELLRPVVEQLGGKIEGFWFSLGEYDAIVILELPDNVSAESSSDHRGRWRRFQGSEDDSVTDRRAA